MKKPTKSQMGASLIVAVTVLLLADALVNMDFTTVQWVLAIPAGTVIIQTIIAKTTRKTKHVDELTREPKVAVVIPAYNEEAVIEETVATNFENIEYSNYEIWVIEDGSTDHTKMLCEALEKAGMCKVHYRPHNPDEAKSDALNDLAINVLDDSYEYICVVDSDGHLAPDAITKTMAKFEADPELAGAQVSVRIRNNHGFYGRNCDTEFINYSSILKAKANHNLLGGNGQFVRIDLFREYSPKCVSTVEDMELSEHLKLDGYKITEVSDAVVSQEAVTGFKNYLKQRSRWASGNMSVLFENFFKIIKSKNMSLRAKISDISSLSVNFYVPFVIVSFVSFIINIVCWYFYGALPYKFCAPLPVVLIDFIGIYPLLILNNIGKKNIFKVLFELVSFTLYGFLSIFIYLKGMKRVLGNDNSWGKTIRISEIK